MYNRDINAIARKLSFLAKEVYDEPSKWAVVMRTTRAIAEGIKEQNPKFDMENFEKRVRGF